MLKELESQQFGFDTNFIDDAGAIQTIYVAYDGLALDKFIVEVPACVIKPENIPQFKRLLERAARKASLEQKKRGN